MSLQPVTNWFTLEEYFALERASERRFEYREGEVVCMSGGSREHAAISRNILRHLANYLKKTCAAFGTDLALYVPGGLPYRYPDASVVCGEPRFRKINGLDALENPVLIVEVLSPTSADFDLGTKFEQYKSISEFAGVLDCRPRQSSCYTANQAERWHVERGCIRNHRFRRSVGNRRREFRDV